MKLSIWQQFSSNHSNDFAIVGRFKSVADAQSAAEELRTMLRSISAWYEAHPVDDAPRYENGKYVPTDVERRIAVYYEIDWESRHEWLVGWANPEEVVFTIDDYVFMDSPLTHIGYDPFDKIMKKMGAEVVNAEQEMGELRIFVNISATAPDAQVAKALADKIQRFLDTTRSYYRPDRKDDTTQTPIPPWVFHDTDRPIETEKAILQAEESNQEHFQRFQKLQDEQQQLRITKAANDDLRMQAVIQAINDHRQILKDNSLLFSWLHDATFGTAPIVHSNNEKVRVNTTHIQIENLWFLRNLGRGLIALVSWLRAEGCEVSWEFREGEFPGED